MNEREILQRLSRRIPSPAMVVACLALMVALGGTSYAAIKLPANSVGTKQLKKGAVTGVKVKKNALGGAQVNESTLGKVPSAGSAPVSRLDYRSAVVALPAGGATVTRGIVECPTGLSATGGGAGLADPNSGFIADTNPLGEIDWEATGYSATAQNMTVYVICAQAASTTP
jgi:hypothetical protein